MCLLYNIKECMSDLEEVIDIIYEQWGSFLRKTKTDRIDIIKNAIEKKLPFPQIYVMKEKNKIIGTFTIKEMSIGENKSFPSVWYLLIKKDFRGKGYGQEILNHLNEVCKRYKQVYLLTEHVGFYEKIGFEFIKETPHNGQIDRLYLKTNL